jgi:hypothetical protein
MENLLNEEIFKVRSVVSIGDNYWDVQITDDGMGEGCRTDA